MALDEKAQPWKRVWKQSENPQKCWDFHVLVGKEVVIDEGSASAPTSASMVLDGPVVRAEVAAGIAADTGATVASSKSQEAT